MRRVQHKLKLAEHWVVFFNNKTASGQCGSASEVVRHALHTLEERNTKLEVLRARLAEGAKQVWRGKYVAQLHDDMLTEFKAGQDNGRILYGARAKEDLFRI